MESFQFETIGSAVAGGTLCVLIARYAIMRAFLDLQKIGEQVNAISIKLSVIEVKLGQLEKLEEKAEAHSNQITEIQSRLKYERTKERHPNDHSIGEGRMRTAKSKPAIDLGDY